MEKTEKTIELENDSTLTVGTITTTPKDGFVSQAEIHNSPLDYGEYHKGYSKHFFVSTDDPRVTRPVWFLFACFFAVIVYSFFGKFWAIVTWLVIFISGQVSISNYQREKKKKMKEQQNNSNTSGKE